MRVPHDEARAFYAHFECWASSTDPLHLMLLMKDAGALIVGGCNAIDYRLPGCAIRCQPITDHSTDHKEPRPVGGHPKTTADLHQQ